MRRLAGIVAGVGLAVGVAGGQSPAIPPLVLAAPEPVLPGAVVSQPLTPVQLIEPLPPAISEKPPAVEMVRPLGHSWYRLDLLVWWPREATLPPLAVAGPGPVAPRLGGPNTTVLIGGRQEIPDVAGGRVALGFAVNDAQTLGVEFSYLFVGSRTLFESTDTTRQRAVGRPVLNDGVEDVIPVRVPGELLGSLDVSNTVRMTGWDVVGVGNLVAGPRLTVSAVAGYRYFLLNEGVRIEQTAYFPNGPITAGIADQFDTSNRFHGGLVGLRAAAASGPVFVEMAGGVGLGRTLQVVRTSGQSYAFSNAGIRTFAGGGLGQPSNAGRQTNAAFGVLPEAAVKVGLRFRDRSTLYVGYTFLYLNDVARPGDQIDRAVEVSAVPVFGRGGAYPADRPAATLTRTDFWVHGIQLGFDWRY